MLSEQALCSRINRKLAKIEPFPYGEVLRKTRGERAWLALGDYYLLNVYRNFLVEKDVDLRELGARLKVVSETEIEQKMLEGPDEWSSPTRAEELKGTLRNCCYPGLIPLGG